MFSIEFLLTLILAVGLQLILLKASLHVYQDGHRVSVWVSLQERTRFIMNQMHHRLWLAGYATCLPGQGIDQQDALSGYDAGSTQAKAISGDVNTDVIIVGACRFYQQHWQFLKTMYFVGRTHRVDRKGHPIFSLYERVSGEHRQELVANIWALKVRYAIHNPKTHQLSYVLADAVYDWKAVSNVAMTFTLPSDSPPDRRTVWIDTTLRERTTL